VEILFYFLRAASFSHRSEPTHTVSPNCSRKSFFAKLGGLIAAVGLVPKVLAKTETRAAAPTVPTHVTLRPEQRAVARSDGSL
jgi:hypothetical protein